VSVALFGFGFFVCMTSAAQTVAELAMPEPLVPTVSVESSPRVAAAASLLPDAPSAVQYSSSILPTEENASLMLALNGRRKAPTEVDAPVLPEASRTQLYIAPGQSAPVLTPGETARLGFKSAFSAIAVAGWFVAAGYNQWTDTSPNYGTDLGAFGQRLGAATLINSTEDIMSDCVNAPLLREDPRYYRMGPKRNFFTRLFYSGMRPIITRKMSGGATPNFALILGNGEGAALTNVYYPQVNRGMTQTMMSWGYSMGGSAIGDVVAEFSPDILKWFHYTK
jgi:hypothetical protein